MLSNVGNLLLSLNILIGISIIFFSLKSLEVRTDLIGKNIYNLCLFQSTSIIICFLSIENPSAVAASAASRLVTDP